MTEPEWLNDPTIRYLEDRDGDLWARYDWGWRCLMEGSTLGNAHELNRLFGPLRPLVYQEIK